MDRALGSNLIVGLLLSIPAGVAAQQQTPQLAVTRVTDGIHVLAGNGGNIGVSTGPDGTFLIDDQFAPVTEAVRRAVQSLGGGEIRFVLNTHWHGDHTGGNENLGRAGALIVAHDNVRVRMSTEQFIRDLNQKVPASPEAALPVVTFSASVTFHLNGDEIHVFHVSPAHTDGDAVVRFRRANVVHLGDVFFNGFYPFIDLSSGGSIDGVLAAVDRVLALIDDGTKVIPGHGSIGTKADLIQYRTVLQTIRDRVAGGIRAGQTLEQITASAPGREWDATWGSGFIPSARFVAMVYADLTSR